MTTPAEKDLERIAKLETPEQCELFERNAIRKARSDLAVKARKRALELRALAHGASNQAERECLEAIYAYERVLTEKHRKKTSASRTWQMVKRHGILGAVERAVNRKDETIGYTALVEMGLEGYAFEAVVVRYPSLFSPEAVKRSKTRISERQPGSLIGYERSLGWPIRTAGAMVKAIGVMFGAPTWQRRNSVRTAWRTRRHP